MSKVMDTGVGKYLCICGGEEVKVRGRCHNSGCWDGRPLARGRQGVT